MRQLIFLCVIAIGSVAINADTPKQKEPVLKIEAPAPVSLDGIYSITGSEGGKKYEGLIAIQKRGAVYLVKYLHPTVAYGVGFNPELDRFCVSWHQQGTQGMVLGCGFYKVHPGPGQAGPRLEGKWTSGPNGINSESWAFLRPFPKGVDDDD